MSEFTLPTNPILFISIQFSLLSRISFACF